MSRYFKLFLSFAKNCLVREMEFRWHFILYSLINLVWAALAMFTFVFIYGHISTVGGWTLPKMLLLTATFYFFDRVFDTFFELNFSELNHLVNYGDLDFVLTKPISGQFFVSLRQFSFVNLFGAAGMLALIGWLIREYFWPVALPVLFAYCLTLALALVIIYSLWFISLLLVFKLGNIDNIQFLFRPIFEVVRIPIDLTGPVLRPTFTFLLPLAFVATIPVQIIAGAVSWKLIAYAAVIAAALLWLSHYLWHFALRHYTSASS